MREILASLFKRPRPAPAPPAQSPGATPAAGAPSISIPGVPVNTGAPLFNGTPVPSYPAPGPALPTVPPEVLLNSQAELLAQLRDTVGMAPENFDRYVLPVLLRFAGYAHLLPASESHHHCGQGGLLRHSLEVAFYSARHTEGMVFAMHAEPAVRRHLELRYRLATLFAGLLHDLGKIVMDLGAVSPCGTLRWTAHQGPLHDWLLRHGLPGYYISWKGGGRFQRHEHVSLSLMREILGPETLGFLVDHQGDEVLDRLTMALGGAPDPGNPIIEVVKRYDSFSVDDDQKATRDRLSAIGAGDRTKLAVRILQVMRRLLKENRWTINVPGAKVWVTDLGVFITLEVVRNTLDTMQREGEVGLVTEPNLAIRTMADTGFFSPVDRTSTMLEYQWPISVSVSPSAGQTAWLTLSAARFERADLLFEDLPMPAPTPARLASQTPAAAAQPAPPAPVSAPMASPSPSAPASTAPASSSAPAAPAAAPEREIHIVDRRAATDAPRQHYVEGRNERDRVVVSDEEAQAILAEHEREGTYLQLVMDKLKDGRLSWGTDVILIDRRVILSHEVAFRDAGVEAPVLMGLFSALRWIEAPPETPDRLVVNFTGSDGKERKGIRFTPRISSALLSLAPQGAPPPTPTPQGPERDLLGAILPGTDKQVDREREDDAQYMKVLVYRELERGAARLAQGVSGADEALILQCVANVAKSLAVDEGWLIETLIATPRALLTRRKVSSGAPRLSLNSRFRAEDIFTPAGFRDRYPGIPARP
ncbi:MAG TPA: MobH family relaxase [Rhodanobacteraceae bacterium]|nr:MobH family relaxase [Rhodanobacteraceae bacterium]